MEMDCDYSGRPIEPPYLSYEKPWEIDSLSVRIAADGTIVTEVADNEWHAVVTEDGRIGEPIPDIESRGSHGHPRISAGNNSENSVA